MKQLLIYDRPVPLNRQAHRHLRLRARPGDMGFATHLNSVPLAAVEFGRAALSLPIVFAGASADTAVPAVLLGLEERRNLLVGDDGRWQDEAYVPAFLRRYPFVLAEKDGTEDFTVCLDEAYPGLGTEDGEPLFDENAQDTPLLANALAFLGDYQREVRRTREFVERLREHALLEPKVVRVQPAGAPEFSLQGFFVVDETRLRALKSRVLQSLMRDGDLGLVYAHLLSLSNVERLTRLLDRRRDAAGAPRDTTGARAPADATA